MVHVWNDDASTSPCTNQNEASSCLIEDKIEKDGSMETSKTDSDTVKNCIVVSGSIGRFGHGQSEHCDLVRLDNVNDSDCDEKNYVSKLFSRIWLAFKFILWTFCMHVLIVSWYCLYPRSSSSCECDDIPSPGIVILCNVLLLWLLWDCVCPRSFSSTRLIKWSSDEFSEETREYFFTSPTIHDKSGSWKLVFRQTETEETSFGLVATHLRKDIAYVVANIEISAAIVGGDLISGMNDIKFVHKFECDGDCGFSPRIFISYEQLKGHKLEINCRIVFMREEMSPFYKRINECETAKYHERKKITGERIMKLVNYLVRLGARIPGNGVILPENKLQFTMPAVLHSPMLTKTEPEDDFLSFMKHPETKVFYWKIPDFPMRLKNTEFQELSSPQLLVSSHGICSVWRLQLVELEGVFRIYMQLRGLPRGITQIKMRHLLELVDNFGECVVPKHCGSTMKYPEFLNLWDTHRISLYPRKAISERFMDCEGTLSLRISLQCKSNDTVKILDESGGDTDWILHN